jgi:hypothetical protein
MIGLLFYPEDEDRNFLEAPGHIYQNVQHLSTEESSLHSHCHENLKSNVVRLMKINIYSKIADKYWCCQYLTIYHCITKTNK